MKSMLLSDKLLYLKLLKGGLRLISSDIECFPIVKD